MNGKDITQKMLERYNDVFADIVNVLLFNGKRIVDEDALIDTPVDSALKIDGEIHSQYRDVAKYWKNSQINIAFLDREKIDLFKSDFRMLADYLYQMRTTDSYEGDESDIKHVDEILMLMSAMSGFKNVENIIKVAHERKVSNMKGFFELAEEKGLEKGLELGRTEGREEGLQLGRTEGADMVSELNTILAREGNLEKIIRANTDKVYRNELLKKYRLLK